MKKKKRGEKEESSYEVLFSTVCVFVVPVCVFLVSDLGFGFRV